MAQYDFNGLSRKVTVGTFGKLTVEQARDAALKILRDAQLGEDAAAKKAKRRAETHRCRTLRRIPVERLRA
ncbi:integrase arm-type DNA-binding domain-containing protein [Sphingomonas sp. MMS24-JH45]